MFILFCVTASCLSKQYAGLKLKKKKFFPGGPELKNIDCSFKDQGSIPSILMVADKLSRTPVPQCLTPSSDLSGHQELIWWAERTRIHFKVKNERYFVAKMLRTTRGVGNRHPQTPSLCVCHRPSICENHDSCDCDGQQQSPMKLDMPVQSPGLLLQNHACLSSLVQRISF